MPGIKDLVADDTTLIRRLLVSQLSRESDLDLVGEAEDGRQAVECADELRPNVIVMDLDMPLLNGIQATEKIIAQHPEIKVILLTGHEELASLGRFSGAQECLNKNCTPRELVTAIRRAHAARPSDENDGAESGQKGGHGATVERLAVRAGLTDREKAVVDQMVSTDRTISQIARALTTDPKKPATESAIKHAMERAMIKLNIEPRTRAALVKHVLEFPRGQ
jgi:DNA-binding NarL/FixJ family response regulator